MNPFFHNSNMVEIIMSYDSMRKISLVNKQWYKITSLLLKKMLVTFFVDKIHGYKLPLGYQQFQVDRLRKTLSDDVYDEYVNNINQEMLKLSCYDINEITGGNFASMISWLNRPKLPNIPVPKCLDFSEIRSRSWRGGAYSRSRPIAPLSARRSYH